VGVHHLPRPTPPPPPPAPPFARAPPVRLVPVSILTRGRSPIAQGLRGKKRIRALCPCHQPLEEQHAVLGNSGPGRRGQRHRGNFVVGRGACSSPPFGQAPGGWHSARDANRHAERLPIAIGPPDVLKGGQGADRSRAGRADPGVRRADGTAARLAFTRRNSSSGNSPFPHVYEDRGLGPRAARLPYLPPSRHRSRRHHSWG